MLKKFLLNSLSSFVGAWLALAIFGFAAVVTVIALVGSFSTKVAEQVKSHSVLKISLSGVIEESEKPQSFDYSALINTKMERPQTLNQLTQAIHEAKVNKNIEAIYLECNGVSADPATLHALRNTLIDFKKSGKKVYAYGDSYGMGDYYVATVADSLFLNSEGAVSLNGISGTTLFFKDFLDKIGIQVDVVKVGTFKSAVEPFISNEMSGPARAQLDTLYGTLWDYIKKDIANARKIKASQIDALINRDFLSLQDAEFLKKNKIIDRAIYSREMKGILGRLVGKDAEKVNVVSPVTLTSQTNWGTEYHSSKQIAVLYATGEIAEGDDSGINCETLVPVIVKLAENDDVKGLVMRVNSPGGSVFGSEQIAEALAYFQSKGKPFAVSMGGYAASGGYWISADADRIFADPLTITGSIGIFGMIPNISGLAQKIGITPQTVSTNPSSDFSLFYPLTPRQHAAMQQTVNKGYDRFIKRVAKGRNLPEAKVRAIAEGRVWSAISAKKIGLVDQLGSVDDAVNWVAGKCKLTDNYDIAVYPQLEPTFWDLMQATASQSEAFAKMCNAISVQSPNKYVEQFVVRTLTQKPLQSRMQYLLIRL